MIYFCVAYKFCLSVCLPTCLLSSSSLFGGLLRRESVGSLVFHVPNLGPSILSVKPGSLRIMVT